MPLITTNSGGIPEYVLCEYACVLERSNLVESLVAAINNILKDEDSWRKKALCQKEYIVENYNVKRYYEVFWKALLTEKG